jgi:hypothetical protein
VNIKYLIIISMLLTTGCAATYKTSDLKPIASKLDSSLGVLISIPNDGSYGEKQYPNSGRMTANAVRAAFAKYTDTVDTTDDCQGDTCLSEAYIIKYGYYVNPIILHWEDRNTEWSGKPDRIEIQLVIYDAVTRLVVASSSIAGKSKWATFGGDHPQELLPEPVNGYVETLYR